MSEEPGGWTEANQAHLVDLIARLKARLRREPAGESELRWEGPEPPAIDNLGRIFGLTGFERQLLLLCAGVELDAELAALCAEAGSGSSQATFGLALSSLSDPHWSALTPVRPLRRWRMLEIAEDAVFATARLRIDERVLHYLTGINYLDPRLSALVHPVAEPPVMATAQEAAAKQIAAALSGGSLPLVQLFGNDPHGRRDVAAQVASLLGTQLHSLSEEDLPPGAHEQEALVRLWERESALLESALLVELTGQPGRPVIHFLERVSGLVMSASSDPIDLNRPDLSNRIDKPDRQDQVVLWRSALGETPRGDLLESVAAEFRLSAWNVRQVGTRLYSEGGGDAALLDARLWQLCRSVNGPPLEGLARHIQPAAQWDDLILPEPQKATLRQIASQVRHRMKVYEAWGFEGKSSRGLGISALFSGDSGTGKTMAAEVLANELHLDLYRIDLSAVVSKYIGETEKNLGRIFDAADGGGVILLFDEADALFGKRSEVKDSHDRYANIEVSYLLQRMESFRGLAILTTNQKSALDSAFQRRLRFVVHFPFPDAAQRKEIWRRVFPEDTPTGELLYDKLAHLQMSGGNIRNVALHAAFEAAESGEPVLMKHLLRGAQGEATRIDRGLTEVETRGWV